MNQLAPEIKLTYLVAIAIMLLLVGFVIFVVLLFNRKRILYEKELLIQKAENQTLILQKELENQKNVEHERQRIAHDMHDDLGAGISALKIQAEFLKRKITDVEIKKEINRLLKISENMNHSMREMLWSLNTGNDTLGNFVTYATNYAESFFLNSEIQLQTSSHGINSTIPITSEPRRNLFLCLKEALNNACKYSEAKNVTLIFSQNESDLFIEVMDDGIGIPQNHKNGNGLKNMCHRMQEQNGTFEILPSKKGTHLRFHYPLREI